ncbi:MAG: hypothetical protein A2W93_03895 [Bacteroidetes bacterium GWF2_43_63]|nr:MAG: hypothetical protein A2W94_15805 [Bacteroidetes bacterium GWE2_42_42]OFY55368.1 MAG: hypothetical protein A2W93_03895 [Bacteroidetes bacterium GWF2_43_63]HBG70646.1 hypothetical protein [Bacteroidales bacterium]HCB61760.1 hypothetical protein [Bacteroidales bacterium]HCY22644.1 hypothetical protein [Bacteroidales bacterium]
MKAMIFAAGKGTRLRPITDTVPKAMVEVGGKPLLEWLLLKMTASGIRDVVINVHHLSEQVVGFLNSHPFKGLNLIVSDESDLLLDTGGGLKKAASLLQGDEPILIHNVDILSNLDFKQFENTFLKAAVPAMLAAKDRNTARKLEFSDAGLLCGWVNETTGEHIKVNDFSGQVNRFAFSGISMVASTFPLMLKESGVFGFVPACLSLAAEVKIQKYDTPHDWLDVGKPELLQKAEQFVHTYYNEFA